MGSHFRHDQSLDHLASAPGRSALHRAVPWTVGLCAHAPAQGDGREGQGVSGDAVRVAARTAPARPHPVGDGVAQRVAGRGGAEGGHGRGGLPVAGGRVP